jgi:hypothetical protein
MGEERYKKFVNFVLKYLSELDIPKKRSVVFPAAVSFLLLRVS